MPDGTGFDPACVPILVTADPVLVFGGCYSNLHATEAMLDAAERLRVPPQRMICTGDVIAYGADPRPPLALIRAAGIVTVMGNCEESLGADAADCGCGFAPGSACDRLSAAGVSGGHCGLPFTRRLGARLWQNSGAIGLPANDGTPRGWFSLLTPRAGAIEIRHLPLDYDHPGAARAMRAAGLPEGYARALESGIWPSFDALPPAEQATPGSALAPASCRWDGAPPPPPPERPRPFADPHRTARGEKHASVKLARLSTLWFNTGTLCNIACAGCYIDSSPRNDRLVYLARAAFDRFLDEAAALHPELREIGLTGGEPVLNPDAPGMIAAALARGYRVLVLTNAMRPMQRHRARLERLAAGAADRLPFRVSLDYFTCAGHEAVRGAGSFAPALAGLVWLDRAGFPLAVAARLSAPAEEARLRTGFAHLFHEQDLPIDAWDPTQLVLFPELADPALPPEIGATAWAALHAGGREVMCGSSRMVVHRKGEAAPRVVACTLQPYEAEFDLGASLEEAARPVVLNHPHCARFCVFGAASCSAGGEQPAAAEAPGGAA